MVTGPMIVTILLVVDFLVYWSHQNHCSHIKQRCEILPKKVGDYPWKKIDHPGEMGDPNWVESCQKSIDKKVFLTKSILRYLSPWTKVTWTTLNMGIFVKNNCLYTLILFLTDTLTPPPCTPRRLCWARCWRKN